MKDQKSKIAVLLTAKRGVEFPSGVVDGLTENLLKKLLRKDPERRLTVIQAMDHAYFHDMYVDFSFSIR